MKISYVLIALGFFFSLPILAQDSILLKGKITANALEPSTVHVINKTQKTGTLNGSYGNFEIKVRENDTLLFSSVQYEVLEIKVTAEMLQQEYVSVKLKEDVNELPEVNLSNINLTGNLDVDLAEMKVVKNLPLDIKFDAIKDKTYEADINDPLAKPVHLAARQNEIGGANGSVNILGGVGLLVDLFVKDKPKKTFSVPAPLTSTQIRKTFDDDFFKSSLGIKEENIQDFIFYLDDVGLSAQLFKPERRLALIEVLMDHSREYNKLALQKD